MEDREEGLEEFARNKFASMKSNLMSLKQVQASVIDPRETTNRSQVLL